MPDRVIIKNLKKSMKRGCPLAQADLDKFGPIDTIVIDGSVPTTLLLYATGLFLKHEYKVNQAICRQLLDRGANPFFSVPSGKYEGLTPFSQALNFGQPGLACFMLVKGQENYKTEQLNRQYPGNHSSSLIINQVIIAASKTIDNELIRLYQLIVSVLIGRGAKINATDTRGDFPLFIALTTKQYQLMKVLINSGANLNQPVPYTRSQARLLAYACLKKNSKGLALLLNANVDIDINHRDGDGASALYVAAEAGFLDGVNMLLAKGADPTLEHLASQLRPIDIAYAEGHFDILAVFSKTQEPKISLLLHHACADGRTEVIERYIKNGGDPDIKGLCHFNFFYRDSAKENIQEVEAPILFSALLNNHINTFNYLSNYCKESFHYKCENGLTLLQLAVYVDEPEVITLLLSKGLRDITTSNGTSAMQIAIGLSRVKCIAALRPLIDPMLTQYTEDQKWGIAKAFMTDLREHQSVAMVSFIAAGGSIDMLLGALSFYALLLIGFPWKISAAYLKFKPNLSFLYSSTLFEKNNNILPYIIDLPVDIIRKLMNRNLIDKELLAQSLEGLDDILEEFPSFRYLKEFLDADKLPYDFNDSFKYFQEPARPVSGKRYLELLGISKEVIQSFYNTSVDEEIDLSKEQSKPAENSWFNGLLDQSHKGISRIDSQENRADYLLLPDSAFLAGASGDDLKPFRNLRKFARSKGDQGIKRLKSHENFIQGIKVDQKIYWVNIIYELKILSSPARILCCLIQSDDEASHLIIPLIFSRTGLHQTAQVKKLSSQKGAIIDLNITQHTKKTSDDDNPKGLVMN